MAKRLYCPNCMRNCEGKKKFSVVWAVLFGGMYLIYYAYKKHECSMCGCKTLEPAKGEEEIRRIRNG